MGDFLGCAAVACAGFVVCRAAVCGGNAWRRGGALVLLLVSVTLGRADLLPWFAGGVALAVAYCMAMMGHKQNLWTEKNN